jgi:hypothetical protein
VRARRKPRTTRIEYPEAFEAEWKQTAKTGSKDNACDFWERNGHPMFGASWKRWELCLEWQQEWFNYPHVTSWLNDGRYKQEPPEVKAKPAAIRQIRPAETFEQRRERERESARAAEEERELFGAPVSR